MDKNTRRRSTKKSSGLTRTDSPRSNPKSEAEAGVEAFVKCRLALKDFILDIEDGLYSKGVISKDTHDIINDVHGPSIVHRRQILLDAVENWLRLTKSYAEFDIILNLFKQDPAHNIVAERLNEARETCLPAIIRKQSFKGWWAIVPVLTVAVPIIIALVCGVAMNQKMDENSSTRFLKDKYTTSNLMLGPSYSTVPYVNLSIFQYPGPNRMARSYVKQGPHNVTSQPVSLDELLNVSTGDRILIIGGPGTGKTRLTLETMKMWTKNKVLLSCELLFVNRLRWFFKDMDLKSIVSMHMEGGSVVDEIVNEAFSTGGKKLCFLFDGLDEYEPGYTHGSNYVFLLMHRQVLSKAVVIVTTRNITSTGFEAIEWTRRYHVSGFSDEQLEKYFKIYFLPSFVDMHKHSNLWQMCRIPLHASLLVNTFSDENNINTDIFTTTQLFEEITIKTIENDLRKANEPGKTDIFKDLEHLMRESPIFAKTCALAFEGALRCSRQYSFLDSEVPPELKWTNLSYFQIEPQSGARKMEVYTFIHPTLMDFLAAVYLTSLSKCEQEIVIAEHCWKVDHGHDDFWKFVCGLTSDFTVLFKTLYNCHKLIWLRQLKMAHCIFEAQSHSIYYELQPAAQYLMQSGPVGNDCAGCLFFQLMTLTAYDMQAIGFAVSLSPEDLKLIALISITVADGDNVLSFLFYSLAKYRVTFSNLETLHFAHIHDEIEFEKPIIDFFECTPKLYKLRLFDVSETILQQLALLAPPSCKAIIVYNANLGTNTGITPYSLINHRKKFDTLVLTSCEVRDEHLFDMRSTPWSVYLKVFGLSQNYIGNEGAISMANSIHNSEKTLEELLKIGRVDACGPAVLDLKHNNIGGEGLVALLKAANVPCSILELIDLTGNNVADTDVKSIIKACLTFFRPRPIRIQLRQNDLTENGEANLRHIGVPERSLCHIYFESESGPLFDLTDTDQCIENIEDVSTSFEHDLQTLEELTNNFELIKFVID